MPARRPLGRSIEPKPGAVPSRPPRRLVRQVDRTAGLITYMVPSVKRRRATIATAPVAVIPRRRYCDNLSCGLPRPSRCLALETKRNRSIVDRIFFRFLPNTREWNKHRRAERAYFQMFVAVFRYQNQLFDRRVGPDRHDQLTSDLQLVKQRARYLG